MLRIYDVLIELIRAVAPAVREMERHDPDLARQCRRAMSSAPLNLAEGSYSRGGSAREALACFEVAEAWGYMPPLDEQRKDCFQRVIGTLVRLVGRR